MLPYSQLTSSPHLVAGLEFTALHVSMLTTIIYSRCARELPFTGENLEIERLRNFPKFTQRISDRAGFETHAFGSRNPVFQILGYTVK